MRELALNLMDLAQNSISAGASRISVELEENEAEDSLLLRITDNGRGMGPHEARQALSPFYTTRTTRDIGLGLPLLRAEAERTGGRLELCSQEGRGTAVTARFRPSHIDMVPVGDIDGVIRLLIACNPDREISFFRRCRKGNGTVAEYTIDNHTERKE